MNTKEVGHDPKGIMEQIIAWSVIGIICTEPSSSADLQLPQIFAVRSAESA